jgi:uncharacterized protein (TIGR03118 family)
MYADRSTTSGSFQRVAVATVAAIALGASFAVKADPEEHYTVTQLVSDQAGVAAHQDANLVNSWGIAFNPFGFVWVANAETGKSTLYDGAGVPQSLVVTIPPAAGGTTGSPTGIVFNGANTFLVAPAANSFARFIFSTEDGVIAGWSPTANPTNAILVKDNSSKGAQYKGLALSAAGNGQLLYATDFHNGRIEIWDPGFNPVTLAPGAFTDPEIPAEFAPFGIQAINGNIYVTYAKQDADRHDDVAGKGLGYVDVYDPNGKLIDRVVSKGPLNAPWGLALAPAGFGEFSGALLVGNFGDGRINAFDPMTGKHLGQLKGDNGRPIEIEGLWGLAFGNGWNGQPVNTLFFTAGPGDEEHGLYGRIDPLPERNHGRP